MEQQNPPSPKCVVVAISAISGGGKSTLTRSLVPLLGNAITLHFDDYTSAYFSSSSHPDDFRCWLEEGADLNAWKTPQLIEDLRALRQGKSIVLPAKRAVPKPLRQLRHLLKRDTPLIFPLQT